MATEPAGPRPCPCGSGKTLAACCEPVLRRASPAGSAEALMRSRFTAHVLKDYEHLHRSHLESSKEPFDPGERPEGRDWTRLEIRAHTPGPRPGAATVDFTAYFKEGDAEQAFHELAEFQQVEGAWYYVRPLREGPAPIRSTQAKVGRNDPCPCGSGKKFKACCLNR